MWDKRAFVVLFALAFLHIPDASADEDHHHARDRSSTGRSRLSGCPTSATRSAGARRRRGGDVTSLPVHGEEKRLWRFATRVNPGWSQEATDDFHVLEQSLVASGDGARMIFTATWETASGAMGAHAINMVNLGGKVVVVDAQQGIIRTPSEYFGKSTWSDFRYYITRPGAPGRSPFENADKAPPTSLPPIVRLPSTP